MEVEASGDVGVVAVGGVVAVETLALSPKRALASVLLGAILGHSI